MKRIFLPLVLTVLLASCTHVYYAPNTPNAPLLSRKGETRLAALYTGGADSEFSGGELQAAVALTKNSGVMASFMSVGRSDRSGSERESGKGSYVEASYGLFKSLDANRGHFIGEVYGGLGLGSASNTYSVTDHSKVGLTKFFLQPAIGYRSDYFEALIVPRLAVVNWKVKTAVLKPDSPYTRDMNVMRAEPGFFAFEPAILLRGGSRNGKLQAGLGFSMSRFNASSYLFYSEGLTESMTAHVGATLNLFPKR